MHKDKKITVEILTAVNENMPRKKEMNKDKEESVEILTEVNENRRGKTGK